jgi:hypothetical protein
MSIQFLYNVASAALLLGLGCDLLCMWRKARRLESEVARLRALEAAAERVGRYLGRTLEAEQKRNRALRERLGKAGVS